MSQVLLDQAKDTFGRQILNDPVLSQLVLLSLDIENEVVSPELHPNNFCRFRIEPWRSTNPTQPASVGFCFIRDAKPGQACNFSQTLLYTTVLEVNESGDDFQAGSIRRLELAPEACAAAMGRFTTYMLQFIIATDRLSVHPDPANGRFVLFRQTAA
jgi:hypothetical protein